MDQRRLFPHAADASATKLAAALLGRRTVRQRLTVKLRNQNSPNPIGEPAQLVRCGAQNRKCARKSCCNCSQRSAVSQVNLRRIQPLTSFPSMKPNRSYEAAQDEQRRRFGYRCKSSPAVDETDRLGVTAESPLTNKTVCSLKRTGV